MNQKRQPIIEALQKHHSSHPVSFHVPGHKNGSILPGGVPEEFAPFLAYDVTELNGLDDFHSPEGMIREAQQLLTELYQTKKSYFLVNGSTVGNIAMILATCKEEDYVFVQKNCHKSILNALKMAKAHPIFLEPEFDEELKTASGISIETLQRAYLAYKNIKALILTYPTYYGVVYPLSELIAFAHQQGTMVLVDEAHGAHLTLPPPFPKGALFHGADIVVHSAHKMLPAMTMGSFLHVNSDQIPLDSLEFYLGALQSSSPSYPIMASLDMARFFLASMTAEDVLFTLEEKEKIIHLLQDKGIEVIHSARQDPLKFLLRKKGLSGYELQEELGKVGIYSELADPFQVLCIWPLIKAERYGYSGQVRDRISYLSLPDIQTNEENNIPDEKREKITELALSFQEQEQTEVSWIPIQEAIGRISAEMIIPYPPGIPLLVPGELITTKHLNILKNLMKHHAHIQGIQKQEAAQLAVFSC